MENKRGGILPSNLSQAVRSVTDQLSPTADGLHVEGTLETKSGIVAQDSSTIQGNLFIQDSLYVYGLASIVASGTVTAGAAGNTHQFTGDLFKVVGSLNVSQIITAGANASSAHILTGTLNVTDKLTAGTDASTAHKLTGGLEISDSFKVDGTSLLVGAVTFSSSDNVLPMLVIDSAALATSQTQTLAHNLSARPGEVQISLLCTSAELGFLANDEAFVYPNYYDGTSARAWGVNADATNFYTATDTAAITVMRKDTGARAAITMNKWKIRIRYRKG